LIPAPQIIVGFVELFGELKADNPNILCDPLHVRTNAIEHAHVVIAPDCEKEMINLVSSSSDHAAISIPQSKASSNSNSHFRKLLSSLTRRALVPVAHCLICKCGGGAAS
jgi:hypothetical protein